ncbi:YHYH domain-containing protein [Mesorhizobium sp. M0510]
MLDNMKLSAVAHGGGKDSTGCHTNHKTGDYHCH